ncbi:undecaprenyl-diphosphatase UppP [Methanobrevibacter curvatus]|uniref:Undecaprenyl-diphosphatase n=1 Tax=Methanobrevibacter curvatus TaxID=49547 RepID=A0A162FLH3_9EURY|nr:undecaprenyl-diphosphatase UppP [Methanobrevibacter curvatus]KZX11780.1 undecaprenyl-diphosphatase [Methanobrevibacter curvatus]
MDIFQAIIIGIVQGLTEFLPISSSAHLIFIQSLLGVQEAGISFDILLHLGTLFAVVVYYFKDIIAMIKAFFLSIADIFKGKFVEEFKNNDYKKLAWLVIIGTIPAGLVGYLFNSQIESAFDGLYIPSFFLLITGILLYTSQRINTGNKNIKESGLKETVLVGISQAFALIPGLSRSGTTISTGLFLGLDKEFAAKFSFLLAIPTILGAVVLQIDEIGAGLDSNLLAYLIGFLAALISGYLAISVLLKLIKEKSLDIFAYYCWIVGVVILGFLLISGQF